MAKIILILVYVFLMVLVGYLCMNKTKTVSDFFLGGRTLGPWLSALAYGSTYFSAVLFIGYAGKLGWGFGLHSMWIVVGNAFIGGWLAWKLLGPRTRTMTARLNAMTMPEFLAARYASPFLKVISALVIFIFLVPYTASVYMGLSYLFQENLHIRYEYALAFMAILTGVYLILGGYMALVITDAIQGTFMFFCAMIMVYFLVSQVGGFATATADLMKSEYAPALLAPTPIPGWVTLASLVIITSFGPFGLPQMVQKFYSIKSETLINRAALVCTVFALVIPFCAYYTGALSHLFYQEPPKVIDELIPRLLTSHAPGSIATIILLLVISASMSSLSSLVLVSSSAIAIDLYGGFINPHASKGTIVTLMRIFCGIFVLLSLTIAMRQPTVIVNLMAMSWGAIAGAFMGPYVYGLYWKRITKTAAVTGLLAGISISVILFQRWGMAGVPLAGAISMVTPMILIPIVSVLTKPFTAEHLDRIFGAAPVDWQPEGALHGPGPEPQPDPALPR